jgi:hypothetical protein
MFLCAALGIAAASRGQAITGNDYLTYTGRAEAPQGHAFLYGERHILVFHGGKLAQRVVLYTCRDGSPFARKTSSYVDAWAPDFVFEDASNGMREGVRREDGARQVFFRAARSDKERAKALPQAPELVVDSGFDAFIRDNWQSLIGPEGRTLRFLIPRHLADMGFRVRHVRGDYVDGVPVEIFRLSLSNVFGWVVPGIDVYYSAQDHVLMRYVGLADLLDASGSNIRADIAFSLSDRRSAKEGDLMAALGARLEPCH